MVLTVVAILVASVLVLASHYLAGRVLALITTALCSMMIAYFLMPPYLSFRVSQTRDIVMIACFGAMGLVVSRSGGPYRLRARRSPAGAQTGPPVEGSTTALAPAIADVMSTDIGALLRGTGIGIDSQDSQLPCTHSEAVCILRSILTDSLDDGTRRISIGVARQPDTWRLSVAAHRVWPPPCNETIPIGKGPAVCTPITFPVWPDDFRANWFDNGYARIYQVYLATH